MRVIAKRTLRQFWEQYPDARSPLEAWHAEAVKACWENPQQIKEQFGSASIIKGGRVVFNVAGNKSPARCKRKNCCWKKSHAWLREQSFDVFR